MKIIYMQSTLALMQDNGIDIAPILEKGIVKNANGLIYLLMKEE